MTARLMRRYPYVGPERIRAGVGSSPAGTLVTGPAAIASALRAGGFAPKPGRTVTATFVVDLEGWLRIADRHTEHVVCAGGQDVLSAGEMAFSCGPAESFEVAWVSNQSTGYCPEPESWPAVAGALARGGLVAPPRFTAEYQFRRCPGCRAIVIVKTEVFGWDCPECRATLPQKYNLGPATP